MGDREPSMMMAWKKPSQREIQNDATSHNLTHLKKR